MISAGATPKAVQTVMGHRSMAFTMTVYGHMFDADLDDLADRLDALPGTSHGLYTAWLRPLVTAKNRFALPDLHVCGWAGKGSNLRPRDYESGLERRLRPSRDIAPGHGIHALWAVRHARAVRRSLMGK